MNTKYKKIGRGSPVTVMVALIFATIVPMGDLVIIPAANNIYTQFADVNVGVLNFILSGPALIAIFVAPFVGRLLDRIGKKRMLLIGMGFFTVGAVFGIAVENALYMAVMRGIVGVAVGIVSPTCMAVIADFFTDEKQLGTMMGVWNAGMSAVGAVVSLVSGALVAIHWQSIFYIYLVALPIILMIVLFLPRRTPAEMAASAPALEKRDAGAIEKLTMPWKRVWTMYLSYFVGELIICVMYYEIAIYMAEANLGHVGLAGLMTTVMTLGTFGACMLFGLLYVRLNILLPAIIHCATTIAYLLFAFFPSLFGAIVGMVLIGVSNGLIMSYYQTHLAVVVPANQTSFALGLSSAVLGMAMFACTYFCTLLRMITDGSLLSVCTVLFVLSAVAAAVAGVKGLKARRRETQAEAEGKEASVER